MADSKISDLTGITAPALTDLYETVQSGTNYKVLPKNLLGLLPVTPGGRLTLTSATPVTTSDVTGATTVYWTPYLHGGIQLWDGNQWQLVVPGEKSLALGTVTSGKPYDVFGYLSSGDLALEQLVWSGDTSRGTAVTYQDGRLCKSGDKTRLLLGTFYTTSTTTTEDSAANRYLANVYNREPRPMIAAVETANSWNYTIATWRQANNNTANQLNYLLSIPGAVEANVLGFETGAGGGVAISNGIGVDSTTVNSAHTHGQNTTATAGFIISTTAAYRGVLGAGRRYLAWLEYSTATGTTTWYGDQNNPTLFQAGIWGMTWQ